MLAKFFSEEEGCGGTFRSGLEGGRLFPADDVETGFFLLELLAADNAGLDGGLLVALPFVRDPAELPLFFDSAFGSAGFFLRLNILLSLVNMVVSAGSYTHNAHDTTQSPNYTHVQSTKAMSRTR